MLLIINYQAPIKILYNEQDRTTKSPKFQIPKFVQILRTLIDYIAIAYKNNILLYQGNLILLKRDAFPPRNYILISTAV